MSLSSDVWLIIVCALILANLPFVVNRPLAPWPWAPSAGPAAGPLRWLRCVAYLAAVALWSWGTLHWVGGSFAGGGGTVGLFVLKLLASGVVAALLLAWPGWRRAGADSALDAPGQPAAARTPPGGSGRTDAGSGSRDAGSGRTPVGSGSTPVGSGSTADKSFLDRLLEVLVGYVLVGTLGFSLEMNRGNAFPQRWEFYAVTLALFLVLAYPGFVWRYMLRRRRG